MNSMIRVRINFKGAAVTPYPPVIIFGYAELILGSGAIDEK